MPADTPKYGGSKIDALRIAGQVENVAPVDQQIKEEVKAKEQKVKATEAEAAAEQKVSGPSATGGQVGSRRKVTQAIIEQTKAIEANARILGLESQALSANTDLWLANAQARKAAAAVTQTLVTPAPPPKVAAQAEKAPLTAYPLPQHPSGEVKLSAKQLAILASEDIAQGVAGAAKGQIQAFKQLQNLGLIEEFKGLGYGLTRTGESLSKVIAGQGGVKAAAEAAGTAQTTASERATAALTAQAAAAERLAVTERARVGVPTYTGLTLGDKTPGGSADARFATNQAGQRFVVKSYGGDVDRISSELLANQVYRELGVRTPAAGLTYVGEKPAIAVPFVEGVHKPITEPTRDIQRGLAADALVANRDVFGFPHPSGHENIIFDEQGRAHRIDQGGTFTYRGMGGAKPYGAFPEELASLQQYNPEKYGNIGEEALRKHTGEAARVLTPQRVSEMVGGLPFADLELAKTLEQGLTGRLDFYKRYAQGKVAIDGTIIESARSTSTAQVAASSAAADAEAMNAAKIEAAQKQLISSYDLSYGERAALAGPGPGYGKGTAFTPVGVSDKGFATEPRERFYQRLYAKGLIDAPEGGSRTAAGEQLSAALAAHPHVGATSAAAAIDEALAYKLAGAFDLPKDLDPVKARTAFNLPADASDTRLLGRIKAGLYGASDSLHNLFSGKHGYGGFTDEQAAIAKQVVEARSRAIAEIEGLISGGTFTAFRAGALGGAGTQSVTRLSARRLPSFVEHHHQEAYELEQVPARALRGYGPAVFHPGFNYEYEEELTTSTARARAALAKQAEKRFDAAKAAAATTTPKQIEGLGAREINDLMLARMMSGEGKYPTGHRAVGESIEALRQRGLTYEAEAGAGLQKIGLTKEGSRIADELLNQRVLGYGRYKPPGQEGATGLGYGDAYPGPANAEAEKLVHRLEVLRNSSSTSVGKIGGLEVPTTVTPIAPHKLTAAKEALIGQLALKAEAGEALALSQYGKPGGAYTPETLAELQEKGLAKGYGLTGKGLVAADALQAHIAKHGSYSYAHALSYQQIYPGVAEGTAATVVTADEKMAASATARAEVEARATQRSISVREALARIAAVQAASGGAGGIPPKLPPTLYGEPVGPEFEGPGRRLLGAGPVGGYGVPPVNLLGGTRHFTAGPGRVAETPYYAFEGLGVLPARASAAGEIAPIGQLTKAEEAAAAVNAKYLGSARPLAGEQARVSRAFREASAELATYSSRLSRHGALSTEFIGSFARGEVSLREFGEATVATIGKFGGWAVAGGLVYGAYEAIKTTAEGAKRISTEATQLERAGIPNFSRGAAEEGFLKAGRRLNVPLGGPGSIGEAQFYATRAGFRNQAESLKVGETGIEAEKLDLVPVQEAARAFGALHVSFGLGAEGVHKIFEELDVGQLRFNARLQQTLPFLGRSASAIANAGGDVHELAQQLIAVVGATGGQGGQGGGNPATLFIREPGNIRRQGAQAVLRDLVPDILKREEEHPNITRFNKELAERATKLAPPERLAIAQAIGGGTALTRYSIPLINSGPSGRLRQIEEQAGHPGDALVKDLGKKLSQFDEQAKRIPLTFERLGAELGKVGLTRAVQDSVTLVGKFGSVVEKTAKPLDALGRSFESLGPNVQDVVLILGALALATRFARSEKALGLAKPAAEAFGRVPVVGGALGGYLDSPNRQLVRGASRTLSEEEASLRRRGEGLSDKRFQAAFNREYALAAEGKLEAEARRRAPAGEQDAFFQSKEGKALREKQLQAQARTAQAEVAEAELVEQQVFLQQQISKNLGLRAIATAKNTSTGQKAEQLAAEGFVLAGKGGGPVIGAKGPQGAVYEAAQREQAAGRVPYILGRQRGAEAVDKALEADAAKIAAGGTAVEAGFTSSSERAKLGGTALVIALEQVALLVRREGGSLALALRSVRAGARDAAAGGLGVAGGYLGRVGGAVGKNLIPAAFGAYLGVGAAEIAGGIVGGKAGSAITDFGTAGAIGYGASKLFTPALAAGRIAALTGPEGAAIGAAGAVAFEGGKKLADLLVHHEPEKTQLERQAEARQDEERRVLGEEAAARRGYARPGTRAARINEEFGGPTGVAAPDETLHDATQGFTELLKDEFHQKGEAADKSKKEIDSAINEAATTIKFYGTRKGQGRQALLSLRGFTQAAIHSILTDAKQQPQKIAELLKGIESATSALTEEQTKDLAKARTPRQVRKAIAPSRNYAQSEYENFKHFGQSLHQRLTSEEAKAAQIEQQLAQVPANRGTQQKRKELKSSLENVSKSISTLISEIGEYNAAAPGIFDLLNTVAKVANEAGFATQKTTDEETEKKELFEAGADTKKQQAIKRRGAARLKRNIDRNLPGTHGETERGKELQGQHEQTVTTQRESEREGLERIEEDNRLKISRIPAKDEAGRAAATRAGAARVRKFLQQHAHSGTFNWKEIEDSLIASNEAQEAGGSAAEDESSAIASAEGALAQARHQGNARAQARDAISTAQKLLALAKTPSERINAQAQLVQAQNQLIEAEATHLTALGGYRESLTGDPLKKADIKVHTDREVLKKSVGPDQRLERRTQLNNDIRAAKEAHISDEEEEVSFLEHTHRISQDEGIRKLQHILARLKRIGASKAQIRQIEQQIQDSQEQGDRDFAVGNLAFAPTLADARSLSRVRTPVPTHALPSGGPLVIGQRDQPTTHGHPAHHARPHIAQHNSIHINISGGHPGQFASEMERVFGSLTRSQLRSLGLT